MSDRHPLSTRFRERLAARGADAPAPSDDLESHLSSIYEEARAHWSGVDVPASLFVGDLAARVSPASPQQDWRQSISALCAGDLYLACGCREHIGSAMDHFEKSFLGRVPSFLRHMNRELGFAEEVQQLLRLKLFVAAPDAAPRIAEYSGRGALASWFRVMAVRTAIDLIRREPELSNIAAEELPSVPTSDDPVAEMMKARYRAEFEAAYRESFGTLDYDQRHLLHLYYKGGLTTAKLGVILCVDQATVARWLGKARAILYKQTKRLLRRRLQMSDSEFDSLAGLLWSQLDGSLTSLLGGPPQTATRSSGEGF